MRGSARIGAGSGRRGPSIAQGGGGLQYRATDSPLHRLPAGPKVVLSASAGAVALGSSSAGSAVSVYVLPALLATLLLGYRVARLGLADLWQDVRWLFVQGAVIVALAYALRGPSGVGRAVLAASAIALAFSYGALLLRTTPVSGFHAMLDRWLPERLAFALAVSVRFLPRLVREAHEIVVAQRLRGAELAPRSLWRPRAWRDWAECVGVPLAVRMIRLADQAALAAEVRGLGGPNGAPGVDPEHERRARACRPHPPG